MTGRFPRGKLHNHESLIAAAAREVVEETGLIVAVQHRLSTVRYRVDGTAKTVAYWAMRYSGGEFSANDEADELQWLSVPDALRRLSFPTDRGVVQEFSAQPAPDTVVLLVRHAKAGKRSAWKREDVVRPLDAYGRRQAHSIAAFGALFEPAEICAATPLRCRQTVEPLAEKLGLQIQSAAVFSDAEFHRRPATSERALRTLSRSRSVIVVSSQGDAIPGILDATDAQGAPHDSRKASIWALFYARGQLMHRDYYARP